MGLPGVWESHNMPSKINKLRLGRASREFTTSHGAGGRGLCSRKVIDFRFLLVSRIIGCKPNLKMLTAH